MADKVKFVRCTQEDIKKMNEQEEQKTKEKDKDEE